MAYFVVAFRGILPLGQNGSLWKPHVWECVSPTGTVCFHAKQTDFHMRGFAKRLLLKQRHNIPRKWTAKLMCSGLCIQLFRVRLPQGTRKGLRDNLERYYG